jgi:hypothetical protein
VTGRLQVDTERRRAADASKTRTAETKGQIRDAE